LLRSLRFWLGVAISALFLGVFIYNTDFGEIRDAFRDANYFIALAALPVYFAGAWLRTVRWQYLLRPVARVPARRLYPVVLVGLMANNLIPARVGELVRAYVLGTRENVSKAASLGTIAVDRLFDGLTLVPMLVIFVPFVEGGERFPLPVVDATVNLVQLGIVMAVLFAAGFAVLYLLIFSPRWADRIDRWILAVTPERFRPSVDGLLQSFLQGLHALRSPADMAVAWVMSAGSWLLEATMYYLVGLAFDIHVGFEVYLVVTAAANLAIAIIASSGGIGPFELVVKQTFIAAGVGTSAATAYAIGLHTLVLLPVIAVGLYVMGTMGLSLGEMFRRSTSSTSPPTAPVAATLRGEEAPGS
jgi:uncharacterized protein (TIRG00374 family)